MIKKQRVPWLSAALCAAAALCFALAAFAAAEDDYRAGVKSYQSGDVTTAMTHLRKASDAGHASAQVLLADILDHAEMNEEAVAYYRKAAEQGHADGEYGLGNMYANGEGVKRDPATARQWITRAAEKKHARAINALAQAYISGGLGVAEKDRSGDEARRWLTHAADNNYVPALDHLAKAYRSGLLGLPVDLTQAQALEARAHKLRGMPPDRKGKK